MKYTEVCLRGLPKKLKTQDLRILGSYVNVIDFSVFYCLVPTFFEKIRLFSFASYLLKTRVFLSAKKFVFFNRFCISLKINVKDCLDFLTLMLQ